MSLGPEKTEKIGLSTIDKVTGSIKKAIEEYSADIFHYSFAFILFISIIGLFSGIKFPWEYDFLFVILFGIEVYRKWFEKVPVVLKEQKHE